METLNQEHDEKKTVKRCKNCRHFCAYLYDFDVDEHNNSLVSDEESGFPIIEENMWCGEFDF